MRIVKSIPKDAVYDYRNVFGGERYHTNRRVYIRYKHCIESFSRIHDELD